MIYLIYIITSTFLISYLFISYECCHESVCSKAFFNCNYLDMYCLIQSLKEYFFIYCERYKVSVINFSYSDVSN